MLNRESHNDGIPPFLHARLVKFDLGDRVGGAPSVTLKNFKTRSEDHEIGFDVMFNGLRFQKGSIVEYELAWGYAEAFFDTETLTLDGYYSLNGSGVRTGDRGPIREVIFDLSFERHWNGDEELPIFYLDLPEVSLSHYMTFPLDASPKEFWISPQLWSESVPMSPIAEGTDALYETYRWQQSPLTGQIKASWQPHPNYHPSSQTSLVAQPKKKQTRNKRRKSPVSKKPKKVVEAE